jgi:hypothetical protein
MEMNDMRDECKRCGKEEAYHDARVCHSHDEDEMLEREWTEDGTDGNTTARVTLQMVIDVPDGISIGTAVKQLIHNGIHDAFCVEILSSEPTNKSAKDLTEKQSYINQLSKVNQEGSETND